MAKRDYPNDYFAWYNNNEKLDIVYKRSSDSSSDSKVKETFDTYDGTTIAHGLRVHSHAKYETIKDREDDLKQDIGLDSGLHGSLIDYVRCKLYELGGDLERSMYYMQKYEQTIKKYPTRKSGVRGLALPRL